MSLDIIMSLTEDQCQGRKSVYYGVRGRDVIWRTFWDALFRDKFATPDDDFVNVYTEVA